MALAGVSNKFSVHTIFLLEIPLKYMYSVTCLIQHTWGQEKVGLSRVSEYSGLFYKDMHILGLQMCWLKQDVGIIRCLIKQVTLYIIYVYLYNLPSSSSIST